MHIPSAVFAFVRRRLGMSLAFRITAAGLLLSLLFVVGLGGTGYNVLWVEIEADKKQALSYSAAMAADEVSAKLRSMNAALDQLSANDVITNALTDSDGRDAYVLPFLDGLRSIGGLSTSIALTDFEGKVIASNADSRLRWSMAPLASEALAVGRSLAWVVQLDGNDFLAMASLVRVRRTGTVEGALVVLLPMEELVPSRWVDRKWPFHGHLAQRDAEGVTSTFGRPFGSPTVHSDGVEATEPLNVEGALSSLRLVVTIGADPEILYGPLKRLTRLFAAVGLVVGALVVVVCIWGGRRLTRPLRELETVASGVIETGSLERRAVVRGADEIARLGTAFNRMMDRLMSDAARRRAYEEALQNSEARFRSLFEHAPIGIYLKDRKGMFLSVNDEFARQQSMTAAEFIGRGARDLLPPSVAEKADIADGRVLAGERVTNESVLSGSDGSELTLLVTKFPIRDANGAIVGIGGANIDITERKRLQEQLSQSQKMETVGQLTGGIAHDFNNLLTVILGNAEMLSEDLVAQPRELPMVKNITIAAKRAAELTQRMLAYSRRQRLQPTEVDANQLVAGLMKLLRRTLEETVELTAKLGVDIRTTVADPVQLESALMNLVLNARDAMPDGGRITISTENAELDEGYAHAHPDVRPGAYVKIAVCDTGCGIPPENLPKVFDPFFTTKEVGKGTGLGLSMVYGFVKQSGGHVTVYSEVGHGTNVSIYLPHVNAETAGNGVAIAENASTGGDETVLVVEDDDLVRENVSALLESLGYAVITARDGAHAMKIVLEGRRFDVLFTDVVMPGGVNGVALAKKIAGHRPGLRVLYTTGYTDDRAFTDAATRNDIRVLSKPYSKRDLARKVREVLDEPVVRVA